MTVASDGPSSEQSRRDERQQATLRLAGQHAVVRVLAEADSLGDAAPEILRAIGETLHWEVGGLWQADEDAGRLRRVAAWHATDANPGAFEVLSASLEFARGDGIPGSVWESGEPRWITDVGREPGLRRADAAVQAGLRSAFCFPIEGRSGTLGVVEFVTSDRREPDPQLLETMRALGIQIGQFIERRQAEEEVRASEALKTAILDSALDAVVAMNQDGRILEFNPAAEMMFGHRRDDVLGAELAEVIIPPALREEHRRGLARYLATGESKIVGRRLEITGMRADGEEFPVELAITRIGIDGPPTFTGYIRDITERKRAEAGERLLARTSEVLGESLDYSRTLSVLARVLVPDLADWCIIDLLDEGRWVNHVGWAHTDPAKADLIAEWRDRFPPPADRPRGVPQVIRTGVSELYAEVAPHDLAGTADPRERDLIEQLGAHSKVIVPMVARRRILGTLTLVMAGSGRHYTEADARLVEELARRAAHAVENARLYTERSYIAQTLQASLLPPHLPQVPGVQIAARYRAAGEGNEVGGDFYDVFETGRGGWGLVIGDVRGKGADAAALTALARYTLRAAVAQESSPSKILALLNEAILRQRADDGFCTALYACIDPGAERPVLHMASGGHPLPVVIGADGDVREVGVPGTLLGALTEPELVDDQVDLAPGDAVVFYTDGVLDAGAPDRFLEFSDLLEVLRSCTDLSADGIAERIEKVALDLGHGAARDDIAVLALRLEGAPRRSLRSALRARLTRH